MSVEVRDQVGILEPGELAQLGAAPTPFRFVVTFASTGGPADGAARAKGCVRETGPAGVCVVVDPLGGFSSTEFGDATGITAATEKQAARAGNPDFREGRWTEGVQAIVATTGALGTPPQKFLPAGVGAMVAAGLAVALATRVLLRKRRTA